MNKYIVLLIIPFLLFHVGCEKDQDNEQENNPPIPVSQYPESILGHWKYDQVQQLITSVPYIDPIYGTEVVDMILDTTSVYPLTSEGGYSDVYLTYRYDGTMEGTTFYFDFEDLLVDHITNSFDYTINDNIIDYGDNGLVIFSEEIIQLTDLSLKINKNYGTMTWEQGDTIYIVNFSENIYMSRVNELPQIQ